jgi:hypothetical protein
VNRNLCKKVINNGGTLTPILINAKDSTGLGLMNPSVYNDNGSLILNLRNVNYTLYHCENGQIFNNRWGPLAYLNPENDPHLRTTNFYCTFDENLYVKDFTKVDMRLDVTPIWEFVGLEDARLVRWDDHLYMCGVRRDTTTNGEGRMELTEIVNKVEIGRYRIQPPKPAYCEKNWMPVIDLPYHFVKWANPTEVVKVDILKGTSESVIVKPGVGNLQNMRGGSQVITYNSKRYCLIHELNFFRNKLQQKNATYTHRFVVWDMEWNIEHISEPFSFMGGEIEFCCGMTEYKDDILVSFGFQDNAAYLLKIPKNYFNVCVE